MLGTAFEEYLRVEKNYSPNTVLAYTTDLATFQAYILKEFELDAFTPTGAEAVHHKMIRAWMGELNSEKLGARSIARKVASVSAYYRFLIRSGRIKVNPASRVKVPKFEKKLPAFLKEDSITPLFDTLEYPPDFEGARDKCMLEILYGCGLRRAELIELQYRNIDFSQSTLRVMGKGRKERIVPFGSHAAKAMQLYMKACEDQGLDYRRHFFMLPDGNKLYPRLVHRVTGKYLAQVCSLHKKSPHVLRHTFATHLLNRGADLNAIKELLGHKSLSATQVYVHNSISKLKDVYNKAHPKA